MGKTIREFATEFSTDIKQVQNTVDYIRRKNKQFGKLNKLGAREFSPAEIQYLKEVLNLTEKPKEISFFKVFCKLIFCVLSDFRIILGKL